MNDKKPPSKFEQYTTVLDQLMAIRGFVHDEPNDLEHTPIPEEISKLVRDEAGRKLVRTWFALHEADVTHVVSYHPSSRWWPNSVDEYLRLTSKLLDNLAWRARMAQRMGEVAVRYQRKTAGPVKASQVQPMAEKIDLFVGGRRFVITDGRVRLRSLGGLTVEELQAARQPIWNRIDVASLDPETNKEALRVLEIKRKAINLLIGRARYETHKKGETNGQQPTSTT